MLLFDQYSVIAHTFTVSLTHKHPHTHACSASPDKVSAHRAKSGLSKEGGDELMVFDEVNFGLFNGPTTPI